VLALLWIFFAESVREDLSDLTNNEADQPSTDPGSSSHTTRS
jgi:hypothetical protein